MSSRIPSSFINELLAQIDIVDIIETRIALRKTGSNYSALCPFHSEKTASFTVNPTKQFYYCFGCSAKGNVIGFLMEYERLEFRDAIETLATHAGMPIPTEDNSSKQADNKDLYTLLHQATQYYQDQLKQSQKTQDYLNQRGLSPEMISLFKLGFSPDNWNSLIPRLGKNKILIEQLLSTGMVIKKAAGRFYDRFRNRLMFPIHDSRGRIIGFGARTLENETPKYLNSPETLIFHKGSELYGLFEARKANKTLNQLILVEGYMDVISLFQHGIHYAVATLGTAISATHLKRLFRYSSEIVFCFDGDKAGQQAAWRALEISLPLIHDGLHAKFVFLPTAEDPDTFIRKKGKEAFITLVKEAISLETFLFKHSSTNLNMEKTEGKAQFAKQVLALLNTMPQGIYQQLLFKKLADFMGLETNQLVHFMEQTPTKRAKSSNPSQTTAEIMTSTLASPPIRLAIALLLQYPQQLIAVISQLSKNINDLLNEIELPGAKTLTRLISCLQQQPAMTTPMLLEYWRDSKYFATLNELAAWELMIPEQNLSTEFQNTLQQIQYLSQAEAIQRLKSKLPSLTPEEKQLLQNLIIENKKKSSGSC
jgi:DNA primase